MGVHAPIHPDPYFVQNLSVPFRAMRFHLVYHGPLPSSGNSSKKPQYARNIRDKLHPQLKLLWETHPAIKQLRSTAIVSTGGQDIALTSSPFDAFRDDGAPLPAHMVDLCAPMLKGGKSYQPLVTKSLDLNCTLEILFLRQEDPGLLFLDGGDLDNRIKTLVDALKMPSADVEARHPQAQSHTFCLLESDSLVAGIDVSTDRLLFPGTTYPNEVHLVIEAEIRVLRVGAWNVCLV